MKKGAGSGGVNFSENFEFEQFPKKSLSYTQREEPLTSRNEIFKSIYNMGIKSCLMVSLSQVRKFRSEKLTKNHKKWAKFIITICSNFVGFSQSCGDIFHVFFSVCQISLDCSWTASIPYNMSKICHYLRNCPFLPLRKNFFKHSWIIHTYFQFDICSQKLLHRTILVSKGGKGIKVIF